MAQPVVACQGPQPTNLALFRQRLPQKPYHTDNPRHGLRIRDVQRALSSRYIQHNGPTHRYWLVYDVDRMTAALDWTDLGAPPPTIVAQNPENGHAHLIYGLDVPVRTAPDAKSGPLRYAAAVDCALRALLGADEGYAGLIGKNPLHPHWRVTEWEPRLYELGDLDSWLDLSPYADRRKRLPQYGLGRNCNLFEYLRIWAYKAIRQGWPEYGRWFEACLARAEGYNVAEFAGTKAGRLPANEVKATAKSVAQYTHKHFSPEGFRAYQAASGRKGGKASKRPPVAGSERTEKPWEALGISRRAYYYRKKQGVL
ncbi:replication initiation protein [Chromohalobacter japonicus]|uniref:replication initiation protein n=1 Tax=Chromohalobacter japonicus TaxID=223900 RepID=UPI001FF3EBF9|nr:replication initiation protein [Chromohalobacter japonicus]